MDYRKAYGLPERYFLSLGRMVEKKNLATLVSAYVRYVEGVAVAGERLKVKGERQEPVALVFVGSGELESVLREQARGLGLRVIDRSGWKAGESSHSRVFETAEGKLTRINTDGSERLAADRTKGNAASSVTRAGCGLSPETTGGEGATAMKTRDSLPATSHEENCGTVFFYGFRQIEENPVFYALAEAFVLPSLKEEWGLVVNEAMAAGLSVIVSRTAGCAEDLVPASGSVEHGAGSMESGENADSDDCQLKTENSLEQRSNGFVFDPRSSDALCEALRRIADQETKRLSDQETDGITEMGRRSREIVAKFSCENFARQALRAAEAASARATSGK
jgi:glycosyltransferase involved in cell wall biosynthesis